MSTAISSVSSSSWVSSLFSKIDTKNQGYIDKTTFQAALGGTSSELSDSDVDAAFGLLDGNSDGKVTESEMSAAVQSLAAALDNQFNQSRLNGANGKDTGFSKEELTSMISEIGDSDTKRTTLMQSIVDNFDKADTDGDGKVSGSEAMTYDQTINASATTSTSSSSAVASSGDMPPPPPPSSSQSSSDSTTYAAADTNQDGTVSLDELIAYQSANQTTSTSSESLSVMKTLMQLMQSYGLSSNDSSQASASSSISAIA